MSRFWAAGGESSDSDDDDSDKSDPSDDSSNSDDSSDDSDDDDDNSNDNNAGGLGQTGQQEANRWLAMSDDSSDEDSVRVVLSGKGAVPWALISMEPPVANVAVAQSTALLGKPMVATRVLESGDQAPMEWGCFRANSLTGLGARRSELPSRSTGFTALPLIRS